MPILLGICGQRRAGKTFLADLIVEEALEFGIKVNKLSFATPLKSSFCAHIGIGEGTLELYKESYREKLEVYSDKCKEEDKFFFTRQLLDQLLPLDNVIVDDCRLIDEEVRPLLERGASIYRVYADKDIRAKRGMVPNPTIDNSRYETELDLSQEVYSSWGGYWIFNNKNDEATLRQEAKILIRRHYLKSLKF